MATTNHILEVVNNLRTINQASIFAYLTWFMIWGMWSTASPQAAVMQDIRRMVLCTAFALWMHQGGGLVIGLTIWVFRAVGLGGGAGVASPWTVPPMALGSFLISLSAILLLRIMSVAKFGNRLWIGLMVLDLVFLIWTR